jgi:hypothetical protein
VTVADLLDSGRVVAFTGSRLIDGGLPDAQTQPDAHAAKTARELVEQVLAAGQG